MEDPIVRMARTELASVNRVSHRLAMIDTVSQLGIVLNKLLPRLLQRLKENTIQRIQFDLEQQQQQHATTTTTTMTENKTHLELRQQIHTKLLQILSHIMKRVRDEINCPIPCRALLQLFTDTPTTTTTTTSTTSTLLTVSDNSTTVATSLPESNLMEWDDLTINLTLPFVAVGIPRMRSRKSHPTTTTTTTTTVTTNINVNSHDSDNNDGVDALLPYLLVLFTDSRQRQLESTVRKQQHYQLAQLLLMVMERMGQQPYKVINDAIATSKSIRAVHKETTMDERKNKTNSSVTTSNGTSSPLQIAQTICGMRSTVAAAVLDFFWDVLLYYNHTPSNNTNNNPTMTTGNGTTVTTATNNTHSTNLPPAGMSQAGWDRLQWTISRSNNNNNITFVPAILQQTILEMCVPQRQWRLLSGIPLHNDDTDTILATINRARIMVLLVTATSDESIVQVRDRANTYLKQCLEIGKNKSIEYVLGEPTALAIELLILCLGETYADVVVTTASSSFNQNNQEMEQRLTGVVNYTFVPNEPHRQQKIMSTKRRPASTQRAATFITFLTTYIVQQNCPTIRVDGILGYLALEWIDRTLSTTNVASWSSLSFARSKSHRAAAELLNALTVRLVVQYNAIIVHDGDNNNNNNDDDDDATLHKTSQSDIMIGTMSRCLRIAGRVLSPVAFTFVPNRGNVIRSTGIDQDGSLAIRDACYGIVSILSRSYFATAPTGPLFGETTCSNLETAILLFGCASNEDEQLRPRAVAALDALLAAYCRVYHTNHVPTMTTSDQQGISASTKNDTAAMVDVTTSSTKIDNPWLHMDETQTLTDPEDVSPSQDRSPCKDGLARSLVPLLWKAAQTHQSKASRVAAARWAGVLLKHLDPCSACHILCFLAGDSDVTTASIAREGLCLPKIITDDIDVLNIRSCDDESFTLLNFSAFVDMVFQETDEVTQSYQLYRYWDFSLPGKVATLRFGLYCLLSDIYGGGDRAVGLYLSTLTKTLRDFIDGSSLPNRSNLDGPTRKNSVDLLDECSACLLMTLSTSQYARLQLTNNISDTPILEVSDLIYLAINANSSRSRRYFSGACGKLFGDQNVWQASDETDSTFDDWVQQSKLPSILSTCSLNLNKLSSHSSSCRGQCHGSAFLGAEIIRAFRLRAIASETSNKTRDAWWDEIAKILEVLGKECLHEEEILGNACSDCIVIAMSFEGDNAPVLDPKLYEVTASILLNLTKGLAKFGHGDHADPSRVSKLASAAGSCLAGTTTGSGIVMDVNGVTRSNLGLSRLGCVDALFEILGSQVYRKEEEVSIVVGEALADYADAYSPKNVVWSVSGSEWTLEYDEEFASQLPPHEHVLYILLKKNLVASSPHKRMACSPALMAVAARGAKRVNSCETWTERSIVLSLKLHLHDIQSAFISLLSYPKNTQLSRECCCLGLAACRGLLKNEHDTATTQSSDRLNHRLLRAFGLTTNFGTSAMIETQTQAEARRDAEGVRTNEASGDTAFLDGEVGGASGIGEAALGAYREMASASVSLGRHDVLYALLMLSVSHPYWLSTTAQQRYNASSLLGESYNFGEKSNSFHFRSALRPHLGKLIPRILRACYDPNKQTREQMSSLWNGLTGGGAEGRQAVSEHLLSTVDILIEDATSKLWRARVGACGALGNVITGRDWDDLGGGGPILSDDELYGGKKVTAGIRLLRLWTVAMRCLDDVRGAVRDGGESLARAVKGLTIRVCDPTTDQKLSGVKRGREELTNHERDATAAAATALRWLIRYGLNQTCDEATGVCVSTMVEVVAVVRPKILEPSLPDLIRSLLLAMSGLEPAALNYLQLRTNDQDGLERVRLQIAQSGPIAAAVTKCLELLPFVSLETQQSIAAELDAALRQSAGFATRAATADAVSTLCNTCPIVFRFPGFSTSNPSVRLLRAFYFASERERGAAAKDKMIHALGNLAMHCPQSSVRSLAVRACARYRASTGNYDDPASRRAAASALRTMAVRSSSHFGDGGKGDIWCKRVLPCAYLGRKDPDPKIAKLWNEVWEEGGFAANIAAASPSMNDFGSLLEEKLLPALVDEIVSALRDVSWSRRVAGSSALVDLCNAGVLSPLTHHTQSSRMAMKELTTRARCRAEASNNLLYECLQLATKPRLWTGKADVLKAIVNLVRPWSELGGTTDRDESVLFGWCEGDRLCPWRPVTLSPGEFSDDLFIGDGWFLTTKDLELEDVGVLPVLQQDIEITNEENLDFEDTDEDVIHTKDDVHTVSLDIAVVHEHIYRVVTFTGLSRFLCDQAMLSIKKASQLSSDDLLPYSVTAFRCFEQLIQSLPSNLVNQRIEVFEFVLPSLQQILETERSSTDIDKRSKAVLVAAAIDILKACFWDRFGGSESRIANADPKELIVILKEVGGQAQPAWTVREAVALCCSQLALRCHSECLRQHVFLSQLVEIAKYALTDRKFWRVRYAGLTIIDSLTIRAGTRESISSVDDRKLILEGLLPLKEVLVQILRSSLTDSESKVSSLSTGLLSSINWWP